MSDSEKHLPVQKMILDGFAAKGKPLNSNQVRDLCQTCAFAINKNSDERSWVYRYFHPLVRAGLLECMHKKGDNALQSKKTIQWTFSSPTVFYKDVASDPNNPGTIVRRWIGFNLPQDMYYYQIPSEYTLLNDEDDLLYDYIVKWETPLSYKGNGLPVKCNPSTCELLHRIPSCSPVYFGQKSFLTDIASFSQVYSPRKWDFETSNGSKHNGFYRKNEQAYSSRIYYRNGLIYELNPNPDSEQWAKMMHCADNGCYIAEYNAKEETITFNQPLPFLLGRILFFNQMFSNCGFDNWNRTELSSDRKYYEITPELVKELKRVFGNKSIYTRGN